MLSSSFPLFQVMAVGSFQRHAVQRFELFNLLERLWRKRRFAFKCVKYYPLQQIAKSHIFLLSDGLQHLQHALFHSHASLDALYFDDLVFLLFLCHVYQCTTVHKSKQSFSQSSIKYPPRDSPTRALPDMVFEETEMNPP